MLKLSDFDYNLPQELIAQNPVERRDTSRLMVLDKNTGRIEHKVFHEIIQYLKPEDLLVLNDTKVIPARLFGKKYGGTAKIEVLLDRQMDENVWEALIRPAKRLDIGSVIEFTAGFYAEVKEKLPDGRVLLYFANVEGFFASLNKYGNPPLPPYVKPVNSKVRSKELGNRYQTVYAQMPGATAAPTAGLHFTEDLLAKISSNKAYITLHTGYGTFSPVRTQNISEHKMHSERYEITEGAIRAIRATKANKGRIIAVGTTSTRLLESVKSQGTGETDIFIYPGYKFNVVDSMITNFHLPRSTLLMLVSAFAGLDLIKKAYREAVKERYRFFSFGDAMLIK